MSEKTVNMYIGRCKFSARQIEQLENVACCRSMFHDLIDNVFQYNEVRNCFSVYVKNCIRYGDRGKLKKPKSADRIMNFCMYCGKQLPDYIEEYNEELEKELYKLGITYGDLEAGNARIPAEFMSDAWWKSRGIQGLGRWSKEFCYPSMKRSKTVSVTDD